VNPEVDIKKINFDSTDNLSFESFEFNFNDFPVKCNKGIIVGTDYQDFVLSQAGQAFNLADERRVSLARITLIATKPMCDDTDCLGTFIFPPGAVDGNRHPIRIFQFDQSNQACPRDHYLIMVSMQLSDGPEERQKELASLKTLLQRYYEFDLASDDAEKRCEFVNKVNEAKPNSKPNEQPDSETTSTTICEAIKENPSAVVETTQSQVLVEETKEPVPSEPLHSDILFAVLYIQDSIPSKHEVFTRIFETKSGQTGRNVFAASDANFDLDLDPHFSEARKMFY
jgi:hypothetical protein